MTVGLTYRTVGPWGPGKGADLTPAEIDQNFYDTALALFELESNPPQANGIAEITVTGATMSIILDDLTVEGPFTLPTATFVFVGPWAPTTQYFVNDVFSVAGAGIDDGVYFVNTNFESASAFDSELIEIDKMFGPADWTLSDLGDVEINTAGLQVREGLFWNGGAFVNQEPGLGRRTKYIPARDFEAKITDGAGSHISAGGQGSHEFGANKPDLHYLAFANDVEQHAQISFVLPKAWNLGVLRFRVHYAHDGSQTTGNDGVAWGLSGVAIGDAESIDAAFGTEIVLVKDADGAFTLHSTAESAGVTLGGTPAAGVEVFVDLARVVGDGGDNLDIDAWLLGVEIFYTVAASTDD